MSSRLDQRVLVLNRLLQPFNILGDSLAMKLLFRGQASVIHFDTKGHQVYPSA